MPKKLSPKRAEKAFKKTALATRGLSAGIIGAGALATALGHPEGLIIVSLTGAEIGVGAEIARKKLEKRFKKTGRISFKLKRVT